MQHCVPHLRSGLIVYTRVAETDHMFCDKASDWGFTSFMPLADLLDPAGGFLQDDMVVVRADVQVKKVVDYWNWDSKKETGFVGLKNQGATCYMNSLLQTLYHIPYFRKVRQLPRPGPQLPHPHV